MSYTVKLTDPHRTDADLRSVDLSIDPNDRPYGSLVGHRPDLTNYGLLGFGRLSTPARLGKAPVMPVSGR
jgi:hypothetical protein